MEPIEQTKHTTPPASEVAHQHTIEERVHAVIAKVRPYIQSHGGDVSVAQITNGVLTLRIDGSCAQCPLASLTYNKVVKTLLNEEVPEITDIVLT